MAPIKTLVSKEIHLLGNIDFSWQRSFHDHIVRSESSYENIYNYITNNPENWEKINFMKIINLTENLFSDKSRLVPTIMMMFFVFYFPHKKTDLIVYNAKIYTVNQNLILLKSMAISKGKLWQLAEKKF